MLDKAFLMSIRDQLLDAHAAMRENIEPKVAVGEEAERLWFSNTYRQRSFTAHAMFENPIAPFQVSYWPELAPLERVIVRIDSYLEQM